MEAVETKNSSKRSGYVLEWLITTAMSSFTVWRIVVNQKETVSKFKFNIWNYDFLFQMGDFFDIVSICMQENLMTQICH